ncbi:TldD/PmbA family protein [Eubacteriales bacterium OttesenSCG-928-M02]|nr:TldD/PmbA family protein [Eubacteriales bacterium OttesenSCG-928-M02]
MERILHELLEEAKALGAQEADAIITKATEVEANLYKGEVDEYTNATTQGMGLRVILDGKVGYAYSETFDGIEEVAASAISGARVTSPDEGIGLYTGTYGPSGDGNYDFPIEEAEVLETATQLYETLNEHPDVGDIYRSSAGMGSRSTYYASSRGGYLHQGFPYAEVVAAPIVQRGDYRETGIAFSSGVNLSDTDYKALTALSVERGMRYLDAKTTQSRSCPVVIHGEAMVDLIGAFSSIFSGQRAQMGLSLLKDKEGDEVAAPVFTLTDTPHNVSYGNTSLFDGEGVPKQEKNIIDKGILTTLYYDVKSANKAKKQPTGNGARGYSTPIITAPNNLVVQPGADDLNALIQKAYNGVLLYEVSGLHSGANDTSGDFSLLCKGREIANGLLGGPFIQAVISGNFYQLLRDIVAVGNDDVLNSPGFSTIIAPSVLVQKLTIAGE